MSCSAQKEGEESEIGVKGATGWPVGAQSV